MAAGPRNNVSRHSYSRRRRGGGRSSVWCSSSSASSSGGSSSGGGGGAAHAVARETHRRLRRRLSSLVLREKKCADAYAYLQSCSFEASSSSSSSSLWALGEAAAEEREEYIEFVRAALTASWASSDAVLSYKVFMRFLDDMDEGGERTSRSTSDAMREEDAAIRELAGLAFKTLKRRREAGMATDVYERMISLYGRDGVGSQLTVDAMRTIASSGDPNYSALIRKMLGVVSATHDVPYRVVRDAYTVAMKACNDSGDLVQTIELDKEFEVRFTPRPVANGAAGRGGATSGDGGGGAAFEGVHTGDPSASAVALSVHVMEASVRLRRVGLGLRHARTLFSKRGGMYMGSRHEHLVVHSGALQWGLNLLSLAQSNESAELAENIINAAYANRKRVSALHCSLVLKACRSSFATASRVLERMKQQGQAITPNHASALISTAGAAGEGAAAFRLFRDLLGSRDARNVFTYNAGIAACGRNGMLDEVEMLLEGMRKDGIAFDSCTYASILQAYIVAGRYDLYIKTVRELYEDVNGNATNTSAENRAELLEESTWVELIRGCALSPTGTELGDTNTTTASRLQQLRRVDVIVDLLAAAIGSTHAVSVAASFVGERKRVEEDGEEDALCSILADIHKSSSSVMRRQPLTGRLVNVAIQTYCKLGDTKSAELLLESMSALGIRMSAKHVTALFIGLQSNGDLHSIVRLHSRIWGDDNDADDNEDKNDDASSRSSSSSSMNRVNNADAVTMTTSVQPLQLNADFRPDLLLATVVLFAAVSIEDVGKCVTLLRTLLSMKVRLNEAAYKPALHACVISGDHKSARLVIKMMMKDTSLDWDQQMYFHLLSALAMLGDADEVVNVMDHLYQKGLFDAAYRDSASSFHTLALKACRNAGRGDFAMRLLRTMQNWQYRVESVHYTLTMLALIEIGNAEMIEQALELHAEMEASGVDADTLSINAAIAACSRAGLWREALAYLDRFDKPTYSRSLSRDANVVGVEVRGEDDRTMSVLPVGSRSVLEPDVASYTSAIHACGNAGEWRRALELFDAMVDRGLMPDNVAFNCAIRACGMSPSQLNTSFESEEEAAEKANAIDTLIRRFTDDVRFSGSSIDDQMCTHVIQAYGNLGFLDRALDWFSRRMDVLGVPRTDIVYTVMISACAMNGDWERAVDVMKSMHGIDSGHDGRGGSVTPDAIREAFNAIRCSPTSRVVAAQGEVPSGSSLSSSMATTTPMTRLRCPIEVRTLDLVSWFEENGYTTTSDFVYLMAMRVYNQTESVPAMCDLIERVLQQSTTMLSAATGREREAQKMMGGVSPELLMTALHACRNASDLDTATVLLRRVTSKDENPCSYAQCCTVDIFNAALQSCERLGEADATNDLMRLMLERNVKPDFDSFCAAIGSCGRDAAKYYAYATHLFETMQAALSDDSHIDVVYKRLIGIFWRARQVSQILRLMDEASTSAWARQPWELSSVPGEEGQSTMMVAKIDLTEEESADVACALLVYALAQLHGDTSSDTKLRAQEIDGIEIWTGTSTGMPAHDGAKMGGNRSKHERAMPATYYLLKELGCPLPLVVIDTETGTSSSSMTAGDMANVEYVRTKHGEDFRTWWQTFDMALVGATTKA